MQVWTLATWTVRPGLESDFIAAWEALGDWTVQAFPDAHGTLVRDARQPNVFISFGPWPDRDTAERWRSSPGFRERLSVIEETLELFDPSLFDFVAERP
ncbi:MAG: hypothetical protein Q8K58_03165 [Acidimicrobiales bacterium]|nr:hypothetical protein [Acidimicrobiales bacterium]